MITITENIIEYIELNGYKYLKQFVEPSGIHEALFVGYLWKSPVLYSKYSSHKIEKETFTKPVWYFYYRIGKEMFESGIRTFDDSTVYSFLTSKPKEKNKKSWFDYYNDYGGHTTIEEIMSECDPKKGNDEYHFSEVQKYEVLRKLQKDNLLNIFSNDFILKLTKMSLTQVQTFIQHKVKTSFANINAGEVIEYNLIENVSQVIDELDEGEEVGSPFFEAPRLNKKINGKKLGNLVYLVLESGVGKSSFITEKGIIADIDLNEKALIFVNEEGRKRWIARILTTVASRIIKKPIPRDVVSRGRYTPEHKAILKEAAAWLEKHRPDYIKLIVLKKYRIEDVISRIELYRPLGYKHVYFDTFKPDNTQQADRWLAFSNSAQALYDTIKEENYNCFTMATVQLKIGSSNRYLDMESIGKSREIVEVAAVVLIGRYLFADEYPGQKNEIYPYNWEKDDFDGKWYKKPYKLDPEKKYLVLFIPKNRESGVDEQILYEVIPDLNIWKEVAYVQIPNYGNSK